MTISGQGSSTTVGNISVLLNLTYPSLGDLSGVLIGPDGTTKVTLFNAGDLTGANLVKTVFSACGDHQPLLRHGALHGDIQAE